MPFLIPIISVIAALIVGAGGVSVAAENALPGDTLYPVKVSVNEAVRSALAIGDEADAKWEIRKAERRLEEVEQLTLDGVKEPVKQLEENFDRQLIKVEELRTKLESSDKIDDAIGVAQGLGAALSAHEQILNNIRAKLSDDVEKDDVTKLIAKIQEKENEVRQKGNKLESSVKGAEVEAAAQGKLKSVENKLEEVEKYLENIKDKISGEAITQAQQKIDEVKSKISEGKEKLAEKSYSEAFKTFQEAHKKLQEVKLFVILERKLQINEHVLQREEKRKNEEENDRKTGTSTNEDNEDRDEDANDDNKDENKENDNSETDFEGGSIEFKGTSN